MKLLKGNLLLFLMAFIIALIGLFLVLEIINLNKIILRAKVAGYPIGGLNVKQAQNVLEPKFQIWEKQKIKFIKNGIKFSLTPAEIGVNLDLEQTLRLAYDLGRRQNILSGLSEQIAYFFWLTKINLSPAYSLDENKWQEFIEENLAPEEQPAQNVSLIFDRQTNDWQITPAQEGLVFDREKIKHDLENRIAYLNSEPIQLTLIKSEPEILENETQNAKKQSEQILQNLPYQLKYQGQSWSIDKETILYWLEFKPETDKNNPANKVLTAELNQDEIKNSLTELAPSINREPVNAQLTMKDNKVAVFALSQSGLKLDIVASGQRIKEKILDWSRPNALPDSPTPSARQTPNPLSAIEPIELIVSETQPQVTTESTDTLGLTSLLGKGISNFSGSPKNRIHNIKVGAAKFNGLLLKSGEEFSFNTVLGEIGPQQGYLPELVIKQNKTVPEYGGGLCQVSTTAFRAAINSGLKITERYAHAFPVVYYSPQGFDATVYPPHPDLRFINDTPSNLLTQTKVEGTKLIFEFYGTNDGRQIKIKGPTILESQPDGSMKTILELEIWRDNKLERQDKFLSKYKSPALYPTAKNPLE